MIQAILAFFAPFKPVFEFMGASIQWILKFWKEIALVCLVWTLWHRTEDLNEAQREITDAAQTIKDLVEANQTTEGSFATCQETNKAIMAERQSAEIRALSAEIRLSEMELYSDREVNKFHEQAEEIRKLAPETCVVIGDPMPDFLYSWVSD